MRKACPRGLFPWGSFLGFEGLRSMFRKKYVGWHGHTTWVRGVWRLIDGEYHVLVTATGRADDEIAVGQLLSLEELAEVTEGDVYAYAEQAAEWQVA